MSIHSFAEKAEKLLDRFKESGFTENKQRVFADFLEFYEKNKHKQDRMPRSFLVENWIWDFGERNHRQNPFAILNARRYTGFFNHFNFGVTQSAALFNEFLAGEILPQSLRELMQPELVACSEKEKKTQFIVK